MTRAAGGLNERVTIKMSSATSGYRLSCLRPYDASSADCGRRPGVEYRIGRDERGSQGIDC